MEKEKLVKLVTEAQNGDSKSMNILFNEFYNDVYYFALKTVKNEDIACDVTQETFVEIIRTINNLQEPTAFVTWMKQITYHQCTRYFKKKKDVLVDEDEDGNTIFDTLKEDRVEFIPDEALEQKEFKETILEIIDSLSEEQRSAIMMYYFDELSVKEIAEIQGVSEGTVKSRLNYGRKAIKNSVEEYEKKNGVKLHALPFFPLFKWLFKEDSKRKMAAPVAKTVAKGVSATTQTSVHIGTGVGATITALPFVVKVVSVVIAMTVVAGGVAAAVLLNDNDVPAVKDDVSTTVSAEITTEKTYEFIEENIPTEEEIAEDEKIEEEKSEEGKTEEKPETPLTQKEVEQQLKTMTKRFTQISPFANSSEIDDIQAIHFLYRQADWPKDKVTTERVYTNEYYYYDIYTIPVEEYEKQAQQFFGRSFDWRAIDGYDIGADWSSGYGYKYSYNEDTNTISTEEWCLNGGGPGDPEETLYEITKTGENTYCVRKTEIAFFTKAPEDTSLIYKEYKANEEYPWAGDGYLCYTGVVEKTFTLVDGRHWRYDSYVVIADYYDAYYN